MGVSRARLAAAFDAMGLSSPPSQANFLLVTVPSSMNCTAEAIYQNLKQRHILVRYFSGERTRDKLRISVGSRTENDALLAAMEDILNA